MIAADALCSALERSGTAVCAFDRNGRYVFANEAAGALLGIPPPRLLGRSFREHPAAAPGDPFDRAFTELLTDGRSRQIPVVHGGRHFDIELSDGGSIVLVLWRDITEQVDLHQRVSVERDRWRMLFEQAPADIAITMGPEHRYVFANVLARSRVGAPEMVGLTVADVFPELADHPLMAALDEVYATGRQYVGNEVRLLLDDGAGGLEERFFTLIYQPYRDAAGVVTGIMMFGFEVTAAIAARRRLETLFNANLIGNVTWRVDGAIMDANDAFLQMIGRTRDDLEAGRLSWRSLTPAEYEQADQQRLQELLARRQNPPFEKEYIRADGSRVPVLVSAGFFPDSDEEGISYVVDLTAVKKAEQRIRELLAQAQAASRAKDEFLAMLGHELRNPLAPITTALDLMRLRGVEAPELGILTRQVAHVSRLVDDLLDVAKITRGEISIDKRPLDLRRVIERAVEMAEPLIERRSHRLTLSLPETRVTILGDEARLAQAVSNVLVNAARYTPPGGEIALLAEGPTVDGARLARVTVRDNGEGIPPTLLDRIFDLFVRGGDDRERDGGLGLGLSIVRNIVRLHGGDVTAASAGPGQGSEFVLSFPVAEATQEVAPTPSSLAAPPLAGRRVLIVDDNEDAAELLAVLMTQHGYAVDVAHNGPDALALAELRTPDVAILDIGMPVMDGFAVARALRERFGGAIRLVALTGYGQDHDRQATEAAGFDTHLVKPVDVDALLRQVGGPAPMA